MIRLGAALKPETAETTRQGAHDVGAGDPPLLSPASAFLVTRSLLHTFLRERHLASPDVDLVASTRLDDPSLGLDSLSRLEVIAELTRVFDLARTGVEDYLVVRPTLEDWSQLVAEHFRIVGDKASITFRTSGSSGDPKVVRHAGRTLWQEIDAHIADVLWPDDPPRRIVCLVPSHHIYGFLFSALLPERLGCPIVDLSYKPPSALLRNAEAGDLVIGTPFLWGALVNSGTALPTGVRGVTSSAPAPASLWSATGGLGLESLVEIFGSTETGGVGWRAGSERDFTLLRHLQRDGGEVVGHDGSVLPVQDHLEWHSEDRFRVLRRKDGAVQIGGVNVDPERTKAVVAETAGVADVAIRHSGGRLHAFVVPQQGQEVTELRKTLRLRLAILLSDPARPASLTFGAELPRTGTGKIADWTLHMSSDTQSSN